MNSRGLIGEADSAGTGLLPEAAQRDRNTSLATRQPVATARLCVLLLIAMMPFWNTDIVDSGIFGVDALRLANIVPLVTFLVVCLNAPNLFRLSDRMERLATTAFLTYLLVFSVAFFRSLSNMGRFHAISPDFSANLRTYVDTYFIVRVLIALQFYYVLKLFRTAEDLAQLFSALGASIFVLSCAVLVAVFADPSVLSVPGRYGISELTENVLGMHYNDASAPYIILAPLLIYLALKRAGFWGVNYLLALAAVVCLESRTTLFLFAGMSGATLIVMGRAKTLVAAAPALAVISLIGLGPVVIGLVEKGFTHQSGFSLTYFLSGRDQLIWLPLVLEWWSDPYRLWFGAGEFGVLTSNMLVTGKMYDVGQAHNAYLEFFLDNGIVLLGAFILALVIFFRWAIRTGLRIRNQLYWALLLCIISFLIACFTGRRFFPHPENMFVFPVLAALINVVRIKSVASARTGLRADRRPSARPQLTE